ncbi:hypothetical protein [Dyadobacter tibetensis]|uniref:hypothetical protein n=1 Tax=Dyadobacter tibetensis TaxID=1211851 RepID=UPI00047205E9|nr:hypothetical protein [Dyadobacter tibetensis]
MDIISKHHMRSLVWLLLLIVLGAGCNDDEVGATSEVQLLSFGPTGSKPGETLIFIGNNLDKVTSIELVGATVDRAAFAIQTPSRIEFTIPKESGEGKVILKTPAGDLTSKTILSFEVLPTIASIPIEARPGSNITIKGDFLQWVKGVRFAKDTTVTAFVSQSYSELVVTVPMNAQSGTVVFLGGGTEPVNIESEKELAITLPKLTEITPIPAERGKPISLKGKDLDLVKSVMFKGSAEAVTEFISKTPTELQLMVPEKAAKGLVSIMSYSGIIIDSTQPLTFVGDLPDLPPLTYAIYDDKLMNGWQDWGWGNTNDKASTELVRMGLAAIKVDFKGSWGAIKFANGSLNTTPYALVTFSVYGGKDTDGKKMNVAANGGKALSISIKEGAWTTFNLSLKDLGEPGVLKDLSLQETGWSGTVYIDHVGLKSEK